jgi:hypothetical protein
MVEEEQESKKGVDLFYSYLIKLPPPLRCWERKRRDNKTAG